MKTENIYKPTWLCRIIGHKAKIGIGNYVQPLSHCARCFLPTSAALVDALNKIQNKIKVVE